METIKEILGAEQEQDLRSEFQNALENGAWYNDIEELLLGYGLEMDYVIDLI